MQFFKMFDLIFIFDFRFISINDNELLNKKEWNKYISLI